MVPHGRGRGIRKVQEGDKPVGLVRSNADLRASEQDGPRAQDDRFRDDARSEDTKSPGEESPIPPNLNTDDLVKLIETGKDMRMITKCIKHLCSSEQALRQVVEEIHKISSKDKNFGRNAAKAFSNVSQLEVCGIKFRDVVLRCIQNDFKNREDIRGEGEEAYLLAVNLLCEVFHNMRLADGTVINVLSVPILEYFNALLVEPSEEAVDLISTQTHIIGEEVQRSKPEKFADFLLKIRKLIVDPNNGLSEKSRCGLMHILESHLLRWPTVLPEKIGEFYSGILGERVLTRVISYPHVPPLNRPSSQDGSQHSSQHEDDLGRPSTTRRIAHADPIPRNQNFYRAHPGPAPRIFDTPPPNMLPNYVPPPHQPPPPMWNGPPAVNRDPRSYQDSPPLKDVERIAADMMAIRLPNAQVSPPIRANARSPGWQAMPSVLPSGPPPNIPTAIVPPGVPPHNYPAYRDNPPSRPTPHSPNWNNAPPSIPSANVPSANVPPMNMSAEQHFSGRQNGRDHFESYNRPGGSGRIISGTGNQWSQPEPPVNDWKGMTNRPSMDGGGGGGNGFDIGTWENPGSGGGVRAGSQDGSRTGGGSASWSTNDGTSTWGDRDEGNTWGQPKKWSDGVNAGSSAARGWGDVGMQPPADNSSWSNGGNGSSRQEPEIGHWGDPMAADNMATPDKKDWRNDSTESNSPSWKKETINLGNWADLVPSPRSDLEDNPLNNSTEAARTIAW